MLNVSRNKIYYEVETLLLTLERGKAEGTEQPGTNLNRKRAEGTEQPGTNLNRMGAEEQDSLELI